MIGLTMDGALLVPCLDKVTNNNNKIASGSSFLLTLRNLVAYIIHMIDSG